MVYELESKNNCPQLNLLIEVAWSSITWLRRLGFVQAWIVGTLLYCVYMSEWHVAPIRIYC